MGIKAPYLPSPGLPKDPYGKPCLKGSLDCVTRGIIGVILGEPRNTFVVFSHWLL